MYPPCILYPDETVDKGKKRNAFRSMDHPLPLPSLNIAQELLILPRVPEMMLMWNAVSALTDFKPDHACAAYHIFHFSSVWFHSTRALPRHTRPGSTCWLSAASGSWVEPEENRRSPRRRRLWFGLAMSLHLKN